jgi:anti-sigma B factor antagonist
MHTDDGADNVDSDAGDGTVQRPALSARQEASADGTVVAVAGEVDLVTAPVLGEALTQAVETTPRGVLVLDLTEVSFLASVGLMLLVEHRQRCADVGLDLRVVPGNKAIVRLLNRTGLNVVLRVFDTVADALVGRL